MKRRMKTKDLTVLSLFTAILCVLAPISVPLGFTAIPISLGTLTVMLVATVLGLKRGMVSVGVYLLLGMVGVPVFAGFTGGIMKLAGPTGGYLVGYLFLAATCGLMSDRFSGKIIWQIFGMLLGTLLLYAFGTVWFMILNEMSLAKSLSLCVIPFLPGDIIKITAVALIATPLRKMTRIHE